MIRVKNLKYAFQGICKRKGISIVIILQVMASLYFLNSSMRSLIKLNEEKKQISQTYGKMEPFRIVKARGENMMRKTNSELKEYMYNNKKFKSLIVDEAGVYIKGFDKGKTFLDFVSELESSYVPEGYVKVKAISVSNNFFDVFDLPVEEGTLFHKEDFKSISYTPVVLGASYKNLYNVGDEITIDSSYNGLDTKCRVVGFLRENTKCISNTQFINIINYNDYMVFPRMEHIDKNSSEDTFLKIGAMFCNEGYKVDETMNEVISKLSSLDMGKYHGYKFQEYIDNIVNDANDSIQQDMYMFLMILGFCSIGIITAILSSIRSRMNEFGVHILCGARMKDIVIRIVIEIAILIGTAFIVIGIMSLIKYRSLLLVACLALFSMVLIILLSLIPVIKLRKMNVNEIIKGKE